jgi:hypothetical protein
MIEQQQRSAAHLSCAPQATTPSPAASRSSAAWKPASDGRRRWTGTHQEIRLRRMIYRPDPTRPTDRSAHASFVASVLERELGGIGSYPTSSLPRTNRGSGRWILLIVVIPRTLRSSNSSRRSSSSSNISSSSSRSSSSRSSSGSKKSKKSKKKRAERRGGASSLPRGATAWEEMEEDEDEDEDEANDEERRRRRRQRR